MVISLALLGYGASGTFLTLVRTWLLPRFTTAFIANTMLFAISSIGCFLLAQRLPFNTLEILWDFNQWWYLLLSYLLLFIPFFFAANAICLTFARFGEQIPKIYSYDLIGAGLGALGVIGALYLLSPSGVLQLIAATALVAAAMAVCHKRGTMSALLALILIPLLLPPSWLAPQMSEYKDLNQTLRVTGTSVIKQRTSPLGLLTLVDSQKIPLRLAPGMSLNSSIEPPPQLGLFIDGDGPSAVTRYDGRSEPLGYLDFMTSALPYHLKPQQRVLILGLGGGSDLLQAQISGAEQIETVELNPQLVQMFQEQYGHFTGWPLLRERSQIHIGEARGFVAASQDHYDLIQVSLLDSAAVSSAGLNTLSESYLYTQEAVTEYMNHLTTDGMLAITRWVRVPPRDGLKLFATAVAVLRSSGVLNPAHHLAMIRGWSTSTLVLKKSPFTADEIQRLQDFSEARSFDSVFYPGISPQQANRYNILPQPYYYQGAQALLGDGAEQFFYQYKFAVRPATDDRPHFFNFFKWSTLPEMLSLYRQGGFSLLELGYPILIITLLQAMLASLVLILLPLRFLKRVQGKTGGGYTWRVVAYFIAIGLAFLFIEIAFIQKFILFLAHPIYAVSVVLCGFLIFSGIGSRFAGRLLENRRKPTVRSIVLILGLVSLSYLWLLPQLFSVLSTLPDMAKVMISLLLIAPLAFCMGMPFSLGLAQVAQHAPQLVPWAWGVNGCASLISAILATLLAVHFGFSWVVLFAIALYSVAATIELHARHD